MPGERLRGSVLTENPSKRLHPQDDKTEYVDRQIADRHPLTVFEIDGTHWLVKQIAECDQEIDRAEIENSAGAPSGTPAV